MIAGDAFDLALVVTACAVALWVVAARALFTAVIGFIAYGLLVAIIWVRLAAADVAITEAAIGGGIVGILLLGAAARLRRFEATVADRPGPARRLAAALFCAAVSAAIVVAVMTLPDPAPTLGPAVAAHLSAFGVANPVTGVLLGFRAIDTLLETVVLLLALAGVWSLAPDRSWGLRPRPLHPAHPAEALEFLARLLPPIGIVIGLYVIWVGADEPGGKFQGGAILAAMWILVMIAGLRNAPATGSFGLRVLLVGGPALFFAVGLAGFALADGFLSYPEPVAKLVILLVELVLAPSVAVTLGMLVAGPPAGAARP
jgi:multisubunit Na+/H+ antiporter MnhB subunit